MAAKRSGFVVFGPHKVRQSNKMSGFRVAGLNYVQYSNIAAKMLRRALKAEKRADAAKREESHIKFTQWKDGKPIISGEKVKA